MSSAVLKLLVNHLDLISLGLTAIPELVSAISANRKLLGNIINEGREPTPEEFAEIDKLIDDLHNQLQTSAN